MDKQTQLEKTVNSKGMKKDPSFRYYHDVTSPRHLNTVKRMGKIIENIVGPTVLDCGCGAGIICFLASQLEDVKEIHGVDLQKSILVEARENVTSEKVTFHEGFVEGLNFESHYFDTVVMGEVLEHVFSVDKAIAEAAQVLKQNGRLVISCPYKGKLSKLHIRSISRAFLKEKLKKYFKIKTIEIIEYSNKLPPTLFCVGEKK